MDPLLREVLILIGFCAVWTLIATPRLAELFASKQAFHNPAERPDSIGRARFARTAVYTFASRVAYPYNWLVVMLLAPISFLPFWKHLIKIEPLKSFQISSSVPQDSPSLTLV
jgi:hypothetical protein